MFKLKIQSTLTLPLKGDGLIFLHSPFRDRGKNAEKSKVLK